jgi:hypothetical protein
MNNKLSFSDNEHGGRTGGVCGRAGDLVAYLYGEAGHEEGLLFAEHVKSCAVCRDELAAFGGVRESVGAWREEVLRDAPQFDLSGAFARAPADVAIRLPRRRSAHAALREFFALSPLWFRAAAAASVFAVCALAALTFARTEIRWDESGVAFRAGVPIETVVQRVEPPPHGTLTEQQADEMARQRVNAALEGQRAAFAQELESALAKARAESSANRPVPVLASDVRQTPPVRAAVRKRANRQNPERRQDEDEELPGLYDLLREAD